MTLFHRPNRFAPTPPSTDRPRTLASADALAAAAQALLDSVPECALPAEYLPVERALFDYRRARKDEERG